MIRQLWARIGRRKGKSSTFVDDSNPEQSVVPLRNRKFSDLSAAPESAIVTKKDHIERFTESVHQLVEKLEGIHEHLGRQVNQNEQLLERMGQLPEVLKTMPEATSRQEQALRSLLTQLQEKGHQDQQIMDILSSLPDQAVRQTQTLGEIHQQLAESAKSGIQLGEKVGRVADTLNKLDHDTINQTEWIEQMSRTFMVTDRYLKLTLAKQNKRFLWIMAACMAAILFSIAGLIFGLYLFQGGGSGL